MKTSVTNNVSVALAILYSLGGAEKYVDIETVAEEAFRRAPKRFGWRTRPFPSCERVRTAFVHANQGGLQGHPLVISNTDGSAWRLTVDGLTLARQAPQDDGSDAVSQSRGGRSKAKSRISRINSHPAFGSYSRGTPVSEIPRYVLADLLLCPPDSPYTSVVRKIDAALVGAIETENKKVEAFLRALAADARGIWP